MNKQIAAKTAEEYLAAWRRVALYAELAAMEENGDKERANVVGEDGREYTVVCYVLPDGQGALRMVVAVDDGGLRSSIVPLTRDEIMRPDGTYVE